VSGAISGIFVVIANAWMNAPTGFSVVDGRPAAIDPLAAMANPAAFSQTLHMTLAAYAATGLAVAGIHAWLLLRDPHNRFHRAALSIGLLVGGPAAILQPLSGDLSAKRVARHQPAKLAALEGLFETRSGAPLVIGGWPDMEARQVRFGISVPYALSLLAFNDPHTEVTGLDAVPRKDWPNVPLVRLSFQVMVALGLYMALVSLWAGWHAVRRRDLGANRRLLKLLAFGTPFGFIAVEAGWMVTEVGRQPWVIQGVLRTADAVTPMPGLVVPFLFFTVLYVALSVAVIWLLRRQILESPDLPQHAPPGITPEAQRA
jgi:cytochrome d ubiquinol oxidase subunit I